MHEAQKIWDAPALGIETDAQRDWFNSFREQLHSLESDWANRIAEGSRAAKNRDITEVVKCVRNGDLLSESLTFAKEKTEEIEKQAHLLANVVVRGNQLGVWDLKRPPVILSQERAKNPFIEESFSDAVRLAELVRFMDTCDPHRLSERERVGYLLCSLVFRDGALDLRVLKRVLASPALEPERVGDKWFVEVKLGHAGAEITQLRRLMLHPVTTALWISVNQEKRSTKLVSCNSNSAQVVYRCCMAFMVAGQKAGFDIWLSRNITQFLSAAQTYFLMRLPPILVGYAFGRLKSHSLKRCPWFRLHGEEDSADCEAVEVVTKDTQQSAPKIQDWGFEFGNCLELGKLKRLLSRDADAAEFDVLLEQAREDQSPQVVRLLIQWVIRLLRQGSAAGNDLRNSTIRQYVGVVGSRLIDAVGSDEILEFKESDFDDLYLQIIEDANSPGHRQKISRILGEFHAFLESEFDVLSPSSLQFVKRGETPVDANLVTFDEVETAIQSLKYSGLDRIHPDLVDVAGILIAMGFYLGLRKSEAHQLKIIDIQGVTEPVLIIREHTSGRRLKTDNATRQIPLRAYLPEAHLDRLMTFLARRKASEQINPTSDNLFSIPESGKVLVSPESMMNAIHRVMRAVCRDDNIRFHHLRHSFACWFFLRHMQHDLRCEVDQFPYLPATTKALSESEVFRIDTLGHSSPTRSILFSLCRSIGHGEPRTTAEHYIHFMDIGLRLAIDKAMKQFR